MRKPLFGALLPLAAFAVGTWAGFGRLEFGDREIEAARAAGERAAAVAVDARAALHRGLAAQSRAILAEDHAFSPPPVEQALPAVEVPDDLAPASERLDWPHLNPEAKISRAWLLAEGPYHPPGDNHFYVTFTFDDGPFPETTPHILDLLAWHHVRATFFVIGEYLEGEGARAAEVRELVRREVLDGHAVGNHTYDHRHLTEVSRPRALAEIDDGAAAIARVTGQTPAFIRPPYGDLSRFLERTLAERGTQVVLWSIEAEDMKRDDPDEIFEECKRRIEYAGGGIVLLHDVRPSSAHAFAKLLHWLNENRYDPMHPEVRGYKVVDLEDYIRATAASPQPFATRQALDDARKAAWIKANAGQMPPPAQAASVKPAEVVL